MVQNNKNNNINNKNVHRKHVLPCIESNDQVSQLYEGIAKVLSKWNALQIAIQNKWGGQDTLMKSEDLVYEILTWFCKLKGSFCIEDLENLLHEKMLFSFNTDVEDGSIDEVAEQLVVVYEGYLHGTYV